MSRNRNPRGKVGIRWKFFGYMMLFLLLLLGLLCLFQVVLFPQIYRSVRIWETKSSADEICDHIGLDGASIKSLSESIANDKQVCVLIFHEDGSVIASAEVLGDCLIHNTSARNIYTLYSLAKRDGGENMSEFRLDAFKNLRPELGTYPSHSINNSSEEENSAQSIVYTRIVDSDYYGKNVVVMLNATVSPVASTVRTIQTELLIITAATVLLAVLLSFVLARRVSAPIIRINKSARELARGNYAADFTADGYREIVELSDTLTYAAEELSKVGSLQRELIANISHDLRTPLTMITGYAQIMHDIPGENTPENVQIIIDEAQRLSSLVNDVLDISKLQSGTSELHLEDFNLTETVREVIGRFSRLTNQDGWSIEFSHDCEAVVRADRSRILQVVYNFINNAITHSGDEKTVTVVQRIIESDGTKRVRIEVTDRGEGIAPEDIPNIWDRYYKVDKLHKRAATGSGLGLSIVKGILELHGARYGVESELQRGSTFWFEL